VVARSQYSLVVLDELSLAIKLGLIPEREVLDFLQNRPAQVDVILTGPDMPPAILDLADQITELRRSHRP
jgi:cob(I)alamin adenosyltransferase